MTRPSLTDDIQDSHHWARHEQLVWVFLFIGLLARCTRFFLRFPLWEDECFLCVNFIDRGYLSLLQPLDYGQVAPTLFLWIELTMVKLFGYNELSLRLFGFVCSIGSLFLFRRVATRLLTGLPQLIAIGIFAVSYPGIRYAAEAKQYASDAFVGLLFLALAVEWWQATDARKRLTLLCILAAVTPLSIAISLPTVFAAGGVSLFVVAVLLSEVRWQKQTLVQKLQAIVGDYQWRAWSAFNALLLVSFGVLMLSAAKNSNVADMDQYWSYVFPPLRQPWRLPMWFLNIHTGDLLAFPIGGGRGASSMTFVAVVLALIALWKSRSWAVLGLLLASPLLHLTASALHRYPYGGHVKFSQHMAGIICLLAGIGTAALITWLRRNAKLGRLATIASLTYLLAIGTASMTRDVLIPYKTESDMRARAFASWFWFNASFDGEALCANSDLRQNFCPEMYKKLSWVAMYQCNKQIYSPRRPSVTQRLAKVTSTHPLRCVVYRDPRFDFDQAAFDLWMTQMKDQFELVGTETFAFPRFAKGESECRTVDYLDEYKFVPKSISQTSSSTVQTAARIGLATQQ